MATSGIREKVFKRLELIDDNLLTEVLSFIEFETNE